MQYLGAASKMTEWSWFISKANHTVSQQSKSVPQPVMPKKLKLNDFYEDLQELLEWIPKKKKKERCPFRRGGLECKSRNSRETWRNKQVWPWSTKWSSTKTNRVCQENEVVIANTLFSNPRNFTHEHHQMVKTEISLIYSLQSKMEKLYRVGKTRPRADCGSDHQFLTTKFRLKLRKAGKITRLFRYDLRQIP